MILATLILKSEISKKNNIALTKLLYTYYLFYFYKYKKNKIQIFITFNNKVNIMMLTYILKLGF